MTDLKTKVEPKPDVSKGSDNTIIDKTISETDEDSFETIVNMMQMPKVELDAGRLWRGGSQKVLWWSDQVDPVWDNVMRNNVTMLELSGCSVNSVADAGLLGQEISLSKCTGSVLLAGICMPRQVCKRWLISHLRDCNQAQHHFSTSVWTFLVLSSWSKGALKWSDMVVYSLVSIPELCTLKCWLAWKRMLS